MSDNTIYEPLKMYDEIFKEKVNQAAIDGLEELIKESKVDETENQELVKKYQEVTDKSNKARAKLNRYKGWRTFIYILIILSVVGGIYLLYDHSSTLFIILGIVCLLAAIGLLIYNIKRINQIVKHHEGICKALDEKVNKAYNDCVNSLANLNRLFDFNMASNIIEKAVPMIQLDDYFDVKKLNLLMKHFGYKPDNSPNSSTILVQSGDLNHNPFVILRNRVQNWCNETYTGTKIISWTESYTDSDGHSHTRTRTQTLVATVVKPKPYYYDETYTVYGNEGGSNLNFQRHPTYNKDIDDEKDVDKFVRKREDDLERYAEKQTQKGKNFTPLSNTEFEILFNALDRDNEVEFRFLFTPLAQNNEVDLITKNENFGDDFTFTKRGPINYISSKHMQNFDLNQDPRRYCSHDLKIIREKFVNYVNEYFKNIYFELAPLLAIPVYQQHSPSGFVYDDMKFNYPRYEEEVMCNAYSSNTFAPVNAVTENIIKINKVNKIGNSDFITLTANSYYTTREVEFVPRLGGDGRMHSVPVYYNLYHPTERSSNIVVKEFLKDRQDCQDKIKDIASYLKQIGVYDIVYKCGLLSFVINDNYTQANDMELSKIIGYNNK